MSDASTRTAPDDAGIRKAEGRFFQALLEADGAALAALLTDDFVLVDVMSGSEVPGALLAQLVASRELVFGQVEQVDSRVRQYGTAAVVVGETRMRGHFGELDWTAHSRYTHVYVNLGSGWQLASAQGTPISQPA